VQQQRDLEEQQYRSRVERNAQKRQEITARYQASELADAPKVCFRLYLIALTAAQARPRTAEVQAAVPSILTHDPKVSVETTAKMLREQGLLSSMSDSQTSCL
jgi:hypothetical protein